MITRQETRSTYVEESASSFQNLQSFCALTPGVSTSVGTRTARSDELTGLVVSGHSVRTKKKVEVSQRHRLAGLMN